MNILFQTISNLTGGLINDITTLCVGLLTLSFVLMGLEYLRDIMEHTFSEMKIRKQGLSMGLSNDEIDSDIDSAIESQKKSQYKQSLKGYGSSYGRRRGV